MKRKNLLNKLGVILLPIMGGLLGALGGAERSNKALRRIMIPLALSGYAYSNLENVFVFAIMSMILPLSMGYGIPAFEEWGGELLPVQTDEGSKLGAFFYKLFKQNEVLANIFTRGTIGLLISLSLIVIPVTKHNWLIYTLCMVGIILTQSLLSWRNLGQYTLFNRKLNWSETLTYGLITLFAVMIIIGR